MPAIPCLVLLCDKAMHQLNQVNLLGSGSRPLCGWRWCGCGDLSFSHLHRRPLQAPLPQLNPIPADLGGVDFGSFLYCGSQKFNIWSSGAGRTS